MIGGTGPGMRNVVVNTGFYVSMGGSSPGARNRVEGNYFGFDETGSTLLDTLTQTTFINGSDHVIGGATEGAGNLIAGSVTVYGARHRIQGNLIGTDVNGADVGNDGSLTLYETEDVLIGGPTQEARNVISGSITLNRDVVRAVVQGNYIGVDAAGETPTELAHGLHVDGTMGALIGGAASRCAA